MTHTEWLTSDNPAAMLAWLQGGYRHKATGILSGTVVNEPRRISDRQLRLFAVACCRAVWDRLTDERSRRAVEVAELYADGLATEGERQAAYERLARPGDSDFVSSGSQLVFNCLAPNGFRQEEVLGELLNNAVRPCKSCKGSGQETAYPEMPEDPPSYQIRCRWCHGARVECHLGGGSLSYPRQAEILRAIIGDPFNPVTLDPHCRTPDVLAIASRIYDDRDWDAMPMLADALQEAGCEDARVLEWLRGETDCGACRGDGIYIPAENEDPAVVGTGCKPCSGTGRIQPVRCRGDWVVDLVLGRE